MFYKNLVISPYSSQWVSYLDPSLAIQEISFKTTPIREWLGETLSWFIHQYDGPEPQNYQFREKEIELSKMIVSGEKLK